MSLNRQAIFETVSTHLLYQRAPSRTYTGSCKYRDDCARKCAIGCLIPDDEYVPEIEGLAVDTRYGDGYPISLFEKAHARTLNGIVTRVFGELDDDDYKFLRDLQRIHDKSESTGADVPGRLFDFAHGYELDPSFLYTGAYNGD